MKRVYITVLIVMAIIWNSHAQTNLNVGAGYFGQTVSHPGVVLEVEWEQMQSDKASLPLRLDLGIYVHPRNHTGILLDINHGFRQYFKSGIFLEESIGAGVLFRILHTDAVYEVNDAGDVSETTKIDKPDFAPSLTLGLGYNLTKNTDQKNLIWLRTKMYWQLPHKTTSTWNPAIQLGFTHTLNNR